MSPEKLDLGTPQLGFALGAVVAVAATSLGKRPGLPPRVVAIIEDACRCQPLLL